MDSEAMGFILKSVLSKPRNYFTNQETKNNAGSFLFGKLATLGLLTHSQPIDMEKMSSAFSEKVRNAKIVKNDWNESELWHQNWLCTIRSPKMSIFSNFICLYVYISMAFWLIENHDTCIFLDWDILSNQNRSWTF